MYISRSLGLFVLAALACAVSSCATMIEGTTDRVRYEGGPGVLAFYDTVGNQIPSEHEYDEEELLHFNYIELSKRQEEHIIIARYGDQMQRDTLRRKFGYGWLVPNALLIYSFPVFTGIDVLTSAIYSFPAPRVHLGNADLQSLPSPKLLTLSAAEEERYKRENLQLAVHTGLLAPLSGSPNAPPAYGITGAYHWGYHLWTSLGYNYATHLEQRLGRVGRPYTTTVHSVEAAVEYNPIRFGYLLGGIGFDHMIYAQAAHPDVIEKRFGRNVMTASFGAGAYFGGLFMEVRRSLALAGIETPEGPGHHVAFTHIRLGLALRFEAPWGSVPAEQKQ